MEFNELDAIEKAWKERKQDFYDLQNEMNSNIEILKNAFKQFDSIAVGQINRMILEQSILTFPFNYEMEMELEYIQNTKILIVEYRLPSPDDIIVLKDVKYVAASNSLKDVNISDGQFRKLYDDTIYKITLRSIFEMFSYDTVNALEAISFNGWVKAINKVNGMEETTCILSIQVKKDAFIKINLAQVDPKVCFKGLRGVGSSNLSGLSAVQPILQINKADKRFVDSHSVEFDSSTNLAAMDWEDFEHLIRELFQKEFSTNGGEVKVTQASRDGGVDAIAFDPDPIRGGKIVIQAKRYTNTVGVSAVRDLYGTVLNEGANKGILVTTSDYGSDSYSFAKGKPLTLLNGANLLYLLEKHGHHAKIDIREAKLKFKEMDHGNWI